MPDSFTGPYGGSQVGNADAIDPNKVLSDRIGQSMRTQAELDRLAKWDESKISDYDLYEAYYAGHQKTLLTDRAKQYLQLHHIQYCENFAETVVDAMVDRQSVIGVTTSLDFDSEKQPAIPFPRGSAPTPAVSPDAGVPGQGSTTQTLPANPSGPVVPGIPPAPVEKKPLDLGSWLWARVWDGSQGDELQMRLHKQVAKLGDSFLIVDFDSDKNRPRFVRNSPKTCRIIYEDGRKHLAVKKWYTRQQSPVNPKGEKVCRLNVYTGSTVEKWYRRHDQGEGGWAYWMDDGDKTWPTSWQDADNKPLGIPVFHFANEPDDTEYGVSELRGTIPQQDRLNKELLDLSAVMDYLGAPQRYATGLDNADNLKATPGEVWTTPNTDGAFGQFDAADPAGMLAAIQSTIIRLGTRSHTPIHLLYSQSGEVPSGESLKTSESGLVKKVKNRNVYLGNQWSEALRMAAQVALVYAGDGDEAKPPAKAQDIATCSINVKWEDPETRNEKEHLESLQLMGALGIPEEELWSRIPGVDVEAIKLKKQISEEEAAQRTRRFFDAGGAQNPGEDLSGVGLPIPPGQGLAGVNA